VTTNKDKLRTALSESRMAYSGSQVLVGFGYRSTFEPGFEKLSYSAQLLELLSLVILLIVVGFVDGAWRLPSDCSPRRRHKQRPSFTTRVPALNRPPAGNSSRGSNEPARPTSKASTNANGSSDEVHDSRGKRVDVACVFAVVNNPMVGARRHQQTHHD